jgi:hypothetical protein
MAAGAGRSRRGSRSVGPAITVEGAPGGWFRGRGGAVAVAAAVLTPAGARGRPIAARRGAPRRARRHRRRSGCRPPAVRMSARSSRPGSAWWADQTQAAANGGAAGAPPCPCGGAPPPLPPPLACQASGVPAWRRGSPRAPPASQCRNTSGPSSGAAGRDGAARAADRSGRPMHVCGGGGLGAGRASGPARAPGAAAAEGCAAGTPRGRGAGAAARGGRGEVGAGAPGGCMGMTTRGSVGPRVLTAAPCVSRRRAAAPRRGSAGGGRVAARAGGARAGAGAAGGRHAQRTRAGKLGLCPPRPAPPRRHAAEPPAPRCGPAIKESLTNPPRGLSASQTRAHAATHAPAATGKAPPGDREHVRAGGPATTDCGV